MTGAGDLRLSTRHLLLTIPSVKLPTKGHTIRIAFLASETRRGRRRERGNMADKTLYELQEQSRKLREKIWRKEEEARQGIMSERIGKYFRYRNNYSCPAKPSDYWWLYGAFIRRGKKIVAVQFQTDKDGKFEIFEQPQFSPLSGWQEISARRYFAELTKAQKKITAFAARARGGNDHAE